MPGASDSRFENAFAAMCLLFSFAECERIEAACACPTEVRMDLGWVLGCLGALVWEDGAELDEMRVQPPFSRVHMRISAGKARELPAVNL